LVDCRWIPRYKATVDNQFLVDHGRLVAPSLAEIRDRIVLL
jgi:hypothetical protein